MERIKLKDARRAKGIRDGIRLSQPDVADAIGYAADSYSLWERGKVDPGQDAIDKLLLFFDVQDPKELDLVPNVLILNLEESINMLERFDRREVLTALSAFLGIDLVELLDNPRIATDEFLSQCGAGIKACWHLMKHDGLAHAEAILTACAPRLATLADSPSDIQELAASLAAEAKIQQAILANHKLDYRAREIYSLAAVRLGKLSGDSRMHAAAISWQADMYTSSWCRSPQPKKAIKLFTDGLINLDDDASLNKADLSIGLAKAYALFRDETNAIKMIEQAREAMPEQPERDPLYQIVYFGLPELGNQEARIYLELHRLFPEKGYAKLAFAIFERGGMGQTVADSAQSQFLIQWADAARAIGYLDEFASGLEQGYAIALQINSLKRKSEARRVLSNAPDEWKAEQSYRNLVKMF